MITYENEWMSSPLQSFSLLTPDDYKQRQRCSVSCEDCWTYISMRLSLRAESSKEEGLVSATGAISRKSFEQKWCRKEGSV